MKNPFVNWPAVFPYALLLWAGLAIERWYEVVNINYPGFENGVKGSYISSGLIFDLFLVFVVVGIYSLIQALISTFSNKKALWIFHLIAIVVLWSNFALIQYFLATRLLLDESLFFFSLTELKMIVGGEDQANTSVLFVFIASLTAYFLMGKWLLRFPAFRSKQTSIGCSILGISALVFSYFALYRNEEKPAAAALINPPFTFFAAESIDYFRNKTTLSEGEVQLSDFSQLDAGFLSSGTVDETYPLLNELPDESPLTSLFRKKGNKPPNIVIIVVESLSTGLVGKRADQTGHVMPFLDSLCGKSLYFPNGLSTSEKTYNVLPALLTSLPNAPNGKMLQQIAWPDMWSLQGMLKEHYYSRFYCGVNLSFSNMTGFMHHLQTDYLASHFDKPLPKMIDGRSNFWGYPDRYIFDQSFTDLRKQAVTGKSRLDIFLTISTHSPYIYPEAAKHTQFVKNQLTKNKLSHANAQRLKNREPDLGSFTYTDAAIRDYFKRVQQLPDYENTIFIITGDHGTDLCRTDELYYYKVPLIIYSPLLKQARYVENVASHLDVAPTLINFLRLNYLSDLPSIVPFIGQQLDMRPGFHTDRTFALTGALQNIHLFKDGLALLPGGLYQVDRHFDPIPVKDKNRLAGMKKQLEYYQQFSRYTLEENHVINTRMKAAYGVVEKWDTVMQQEKATIPTDLSAANIDVGGFMGHLPEHRQKIKISVSYETLQQSEAMLDSLPRLVMSLENPGEKTLVAYYTIEPTLSGPFKKGKWNTVTYTLVIKPGELKPLKKNHDFRFYLAKTISRPQKLRNFSTVVCRDKK